MPEPVAAGASITTGASEALTQFLYRVPVGLVQMSLDGAIEMMNPKAAQLLMPLAPDGDLDNLFVVLERHAPTLRDAIAGFDGASGPVCDGWRIPIADDAGQATRVLSIDLTKLDASTAMVVIGDATGDAEREQEEIARQLRRAARIDVLTSMPNRTALLERLRSVLEREPIDSGYEFAVLHLNCDRFRQINDGFGHQAGDELLALMAGRLRATLRPGDRVGRTTESEQITARISGDEFVVLLEDLRHPADVQAVVARLVDALSRPYRVGPHELRCTVSIGIASRSATSVDADALLQDASIAMDEAKRAGGACHRVFEAPMRVRAARRGGIESELRHALEADELFVVYQPVVGLRPDGDVDAGAGVEALVRWRHPVRGIIPPIEFIDVAESTGMIAGLGDFVLATACRQFVGWRAKLGTRAPRMLAVNVSRAQLAADDFVGTVKRVLREVGMDAAHLQLEITESLAAQHEGVQARLHQLRAVGVALALDDFGTGYSSLSSLHLLPVDTVKIDRSFVARVDVSAHHRVLIEATVRVARSLGMSTVAEGIETDGQAARVRELGCDKGQGYLFSRPLPADAVPGWLLDRERLAA